MILGIFFARFLSEQGTRVVHQSPPGCIVPSPSSSSSSPSSKPQLIDWETLSEYVIPRQAFCNRYVSVLDPSSKYRVLGHPVCIKNEELYYRNEFIFNFGMVVDGEIALDELVYEGVVRRLAAFFTEMEIQERFLSLEGEGKERRSIRALLEIIREDLNNYHECMIPVDDANTINMKLFPVHTHPPPIKAWTVPVPKVLLPTLVDPTWDLTMLSAIPYLDSIRPCHQISTTASLSPDLTLIALQHLLYYDSILLLDVFLFSNTYALTPAFHEYVMDEGGEELQEECAQYVYVNGPRLGGFWLVRLFASLCGCGRTVKEWLALHMANGFRVLEYVDVRRFIQFGLIKGLIYRIHRYPVSAQKMADLATGKPSFYGSQMARQTIQTPEQDLSPVKGNTHTLHSEPSTQSLSSEWTITTDTITTTDTTATASPESERRLDPSLLAGSVDGTRCFDQITAEHGVGEEKILGLLKGWMKGDVELIYR